MSSTDKTPAQKRKDAQVQIDAKFAAASALLKEAEEIGKIAGIYFGGSTDIATLKESVIEGAQYFDSSYC